MSRNIEKVPLAELQPDGKIKNVLKDAVLMDIKESNDPWASVTLDDGSVIRYKHPVLKVFKLVDAYDEAGNPVYLMQHSPMISANVPDSQKKR
ncbi:hypothetical protein [uncultured Sphaerochaeta sp.]|uniref:hypothetical protein n=1 Tax=uncultured Sphaerochaeta sp. TaxID=886478 RepID=UPI0029CA78FE|nr:hypothetical protein [uncultured Sphaerochaeta sp.]